METETMKEKEFKSGDREDSKRIVMLLSNCFDPDPRVHQEAKALVRDGHDVSIIGWDRDLKRPPYEQIDGIKVERIYVKSTHGRGTSQILFLLWFWIKALKSLIKKDFDVIHCHDFDTLPLGLLAGKLKRKWVVYDAHEDYVGMLTGSVHAPILTAIKFVETLLIKRVDLLITIGEILKGEFEERGAKNVCVVGNWKDPKEYEFSNATLKAQKEKLGIPENKLVITYIAWLTHERQMPSLLQAVKANKNVFLLIGGDGPYRDQIEREAAEAENVLYLGPVDPYDVPLYTALADIIFYGFDVNNPNAKYSAPNKLFEALAAGKAVITGDFGEIGKIVREERCGVVVPDYNGERLERIFKERLNREDVEEYKRRAKSIGSHKFHWKLAEGILLGSYKNCPPSRKFE